MPNFQVSDSVTVTGQSLNFLSPFEAFTTIYALEEIVASTMTVKVGRKRILDDPRSMQLFYSSASPIAFFPQNSFV